MSTQLARLSPESQAVLDRFDALVASRLGRDAAARYLERAACAGSVDEETPDE